MRLPRYSAPILLVVVAAIAGYVLARAGSSKHQPPQLSRTLSTKAFAVRYPSDWATTTPSTVPELSTPGTVAVGPTAVATGERLTLGTSAASTVGALPSAFLRSLDAAPHPQTVQLGTLRFDRYLDLHPRGGGGVTTLYLLATDSSTIAAACVAPHADSSFTAQCEQVLGTMRLAAGTTVAYGVDAAYALALNQALAQLNAARAGDGAGLKAPSLATRARAAQRLAAAETTAAGTIGKLSAGSAATVNRRIATALRDAGQAYAALATAARKDQTSGYDAAARRLTADQRALTVAFRKLAALGYQLR
jgi:hypothetical protein